MPILPARSLRALASVLFLVLVGLAHGQESARGYALRGTLLTPDGPIANGILLVRYGRIVAAGATVDLPPGLQIVDTHGVIAPGLIDLHNHLTWNVFPRWHPPQEFGNRYDWQQKAIYQTMMESPHHSLVAAGVECRMERYAEVKALTEGETAVVGSLKNACSQGLARNLDTEPAWKVAYNVFPLQMPESELNVIRDGLTSHQLHAFLIHLAEGSYKDASAAREFTMLKGRGLLLPGVALIHGVALKPADFTEMAAHQVSFIWSPRSNLELYGTTADLSAAKAAGVKIALAPDWSPTGSDGLLAELSYAAAWNQTQTPPLFTDRELVTMATSTPAEIVGASEQIGALLPGQDADLLILRQPPGAAHDPYWTVTHASAGDVALVTVDGAPLYGDPELVNALTTGKVPEKIQLCGQQKVLNFLGSHGHADAADESWAETTTALAQELGHYGRKLAPLAECGQ